MPDWIDQYVAESELVPSPESYRLWSAITAISGVLERKVWSTGLAGPIYPNLFTFLVGPPGSGKDNAIRPIRELWGKVQGLNISPDNVTKASLIDALAKSLRTVINGASTAYSFSAMSVPCPELGVFFTHHDLEFLSVINHIYMSPPTYREERRTAGVIEINKPHLVILGGTQPDFLNSILPEEAWGMGFTARVIMIYADGAMTSNLFGTSAVRASNLVSGLQEMFKYKGEFSWTQTAIDEINAWNNAGGPPIPTHTKLLHYNRRRGLHVIKLAMISSAARSPEMIVTIDDLERAQSWLLEAEKRMPDVFRAMGQRSDTQVLADLHFHMYRKWSSVVLSERKGLPTSVMYQFLESRVPSEKIKSLLDVAQKSGYIRQGAYPDEWIPNDITRIGSV